MATTITFGDCAENHAGMQVLGKRAAAGLAVEELLAAKARFEERGALCELVDLVAGGGVGHLGPESAEVLVIRGGAKALGVAADDLNAEHRALAHDKKALMRGRVVNKLARHNLCFAETGQEPVYSEGRGRVVPFAGVPLTAKVRDALPAFFGAKATGLLGEGNYYYDVRRCGIGFHGDTERSIVVALRLGESIPLHFQWFSRGKPVGNRVAIELGHGDMYAMSAKAVGADWRRSTIMTLRHAAGCEKFLQIAP